MPRLKLQENTNDLEYSSSAAVLRGLTIVGQWWKSTGIAHYWPITPSLWRVKRSLDEALIPDEFRFKNANQGLDFKS